MMSPVDKETVTLENSEETLLAHKRYNCRQKPCPIHDRTDHHMRGWPQHWRADRYMIERICPCGIGHPDPDDPNKDRVHGCCGCCVLKKTE